MNNADYIRALRPALPPEAFRPNPWAYLPIAINLAIVIAGWVATRHVPHAWWPALGLVVGNSMSILSFYAHDVTHRSVTTNKWLLYPTELVLWSIIFVPASLWRRVHGTHHAETNGDHDPDRRFLAHELTPVGRVAAAAMFPNRALRWGFVYLFYWLAFPWRHAVALLYPGESKPDFVTAKPRWTRGEKIRVGFEFVVIVAFQVALSKFTHGAYVWVGILPVFITSAVVAWYFFTNHGLKPIDDGHDVLAASTSVIVPEVFNRLHSNFAYHTEHHLFPTMNPKYYPLVGALFRDRFPERYHCIPIAQAWAGLWRNAVASPHVGAPASPAVASEKSPQAEPAAAT
jgi:fatty acid desaturase